MKNVNPLTSGAVAITAALMLLMPVVANAQTVSGVIVPGTSDLWLAGMPDGTISGGDSAPTNSPVLVPGLNISNGGFLTFVVTGSVAFFGVPPTDPPDGSFLFGHATENGMSSIFVPIDALIGVFLTDAQPSLSAAPGGFDYLAAPGLAFPSLSPALKEVFYIGDGLTGNGVGAVQQFNIPDGATRLFLGTMDSPGSMFDNTGQFNLAVTRVGGLGVAAPEPASMTLLGVGMGITGLLLRRRAR